MEEIIRLTPSKGLLAAFEQFDPVTYRRNRLFRSEFLDIRNGGFKPLARFDRNHAL